MKESDKAAPASRFAVDHEAIKAAVHNAFGIEMRQALASHVSLTPGEIEQILLNFKANIVKELSGTVAKDQEALADKDARLEALEAENKKLNGGELAKKDAEIKALTDRVAEMGQGYEAHKLANMTADEKRAANQVPAQVVDPAIPPNHGYTKYAEGQTLHGHGPQVKGDHVETVVHHNVVNDPSSPATMREDAELRKTAGVRSDGTQPGQPPLHSRKPGDPDGKKETNVGRLEGRQTKEGWEGPMHGQEAAQGNPNVANKTMGPGPNPGRADFGSQHELGPAPGKGEAPKLPAKDQPAKKVTK